MKNKKPLVIEGSPTVNKDLLYATGAKLHDSCFYIQTDKKYLITQSHEYGTAQKDSKMDVVINDEIYSKKLGDDDSASGVIDIFLKEKGITDFRMPYDSSAGLVNELKDRGYRIELIEGDVFPQRRCKSKDEIEKITYVQRANEKAMDNAIAKIRDSTIGKDGLLYDTDGGVLTSEKVRKVIDSTLLQYDCISGESAIVSCGDDCVTVHDIGKGLLYANSSIIIDIFPCSRETGYFADMTRTVVRGKASKKIKAMYNAVKGAQDFALSKILAGYGNRDLTSDVRDFFEKKGFKTDVKNSKGFFHALGHGLGLDMHEIPLGKIDLKTNDVFTIEPGLYYKGVGGVRLEDLVVIKRNKPPMNLTKYPYFLEI